MLDVFNSVHVLLFDI